MARARGKRNRTLYVGDSKALRISHPVPASHRLGMKDRGKGQKRLGPSPKTEGPLSLLAKEHGVLRYSPAAPGYLDNG